MFELGHLRHSEIVPLDDEFGLRDTASPSYQTRSRSRSSSGDEGEGEEEAKDSDRRPLLATHSDGAGHRYGHGDDDDDDDDVVVGWGRLLHTARLEKLKEYWRYFRQARTNAEVSIT